MKKIFTLLVFCTSLSFFVPEDNESRETKIVWSPKRLTWDAFRGQKNPESDGMASTWSYLDMTIEDVELDSAIISVKAIFLPNKSWVVQKDRVVLSHENGHFDISELYARKLRKKISDTHFHADEFRKELYAIYYELDESMDNYHDRYDLETEESTDLEMQVYWEKKIADKLLYYDDYKGTHVVIKFDKEEINLLKQVDKP